MGGGGGCTASCSDSMIADVLKPTVKQSPGGTTACRRGCVEDFKMDRQFSLYNPITELVVGNADTSSLDQERFV